MILTILIVIYLMVALGVFIIIGALGSASKALSKREYNLLILASMFWPFAAIHIWWQNRKD